LKNHLSSHPKQKVIEALVRLSETGDVEKGGSSPPPTDGASSTSSSINTAIVNQTWNQGNLVNMPPSIPSMQGNHLFIYQQSMSSTTTPQQNVLNVNPPSQQYVIPTILNPQMMPPYIYQQQVIMSSGSCLSPMRTHPFELPPATSQTASISDGCTISEAPPGEDDAQPKKPEADLDNDDETVAVPAESETGTVVCV
jgi:hypothetical protein